MMASSKSLADLTVAEVTAWLVSVRLNNAFSKEFTEQQIDGECLVDAEDSDFDRSDFVNARSMHWKKFWKKLAEVKKNGVQLDGKATAGVAVPSAVVKIELEVPAPRKTSRLIDASSDGLSNFSPVFGLNTTPETTLAAAVVEMQKSAKYGEKFKKLSIAVHGAKMFAEAFRREHQKTKKYDLTKLSDDRIAAINFFTLETPFYGCLNASLRSTNRSDIKPFFHWMKLCLSALYCLPLATATVYRGVKLDLKDMYPKGRKFVNWSFSSTTSSLEVLQSDQFMGTIGNRTMFTYRSSYLVNIRDFSSVQDEDELLLLPGTPLVVKSVLDAGNGLTMIQVEDDCSSPPLMDFTHPESPAKLAMAKKVKEEEARQRAIEAQAQRQTVIAAQTQTAINAQKMAAMAAEKMAEAEAERQAIEAMKKAEAAAAEAASKAQVAAAEAQREAAAEAYATRRAQEKFLEEERCTAAAARATEVQLALPQPTPIPSATPIPIATATPIPAPRSTPTPTPIPTPTLAPPPIPPGMQRITVVCPPNIGPGMMLRVSHAGLAYDVAVPRGVYPGHQFEALIPSAPAPPPPPRGRDARFVARITRFYGHYQPAKLQEPGFIDYVATTYAGRHHELFAQLEAQYGPENFPENFDKGEWTKYENIDMFGAGDVEKVDNWRSRSSIKQLKEMVVKKGYSSFFVGAKGFLSFKYAVLKKFPWQLAKKHCSPTRNYKGTLYIYTRPAHLRLPPEPTLDILAASGAKFFSFKTGLPLFRTEVFRFYKQGNQFVTEGNKSGRNVYNRQGDKIVHTSGGVSAHVSRNGDLIWSHGYSSRIMV